MDQEHSLLKYRRLGQITSLAVFWLGMAYAVTTFLGLRSLQSPLDPIGDPFFTLMEILTLLIAPLMAVSMVAIHCYSSQNDKVYSLIALLFMFLMAGITSCVHFVVLTISHQPEVEQLAGVSFLFSFEWPSVVYALDILAWDWFFALSVLFAAPVFRIGRLEKMVRTLLMVTGILSLAGLIGVPLDNMQIRNIGIIGYALIGPVAFLLIGSILGRSESLRAE